MPADARLRCAAEIFGSQLVLLSSMQKTASVVMHRMYQLGLENEILFVDTGFHFPETLRLRDQFIRQYKLNIVTLYPPQTPEQQEKQYQCKLYQDVGGQPICCQLCNKAPFLHYLHENKKTVVAKGLRQDENKGRKQLQPIMVDPEVQGFSLHPIFDWTEAQVDEYCRQHRVPVHPLHAQSFPSIGCAPCTTPVAPGESPRAGRWRHLRSENDQTPVFCRMNYSDGAGV